MFRVLCTLVGVLPGSVADHVGMLVPGARWMMVPKQNRCAVQRGVLV
jgi:hypothetical protein